MLTRAMPISDLPRQTPVGCTGTPLARKLGIREMSTVALVGADSGFSIPDLPLGAVIRRSARGRSDVTVWFVHSADELGARIGDMATRADKSALWICWPKNRAGIRTGVTEHAVRAAGLSNGLVDFKIAAIDETWSGLRFASVANRANRSRAKPGQ
jgi:hypothetical protein